MSEERAQRRVAAAYVHKGQFDDMHRELAKYLEANPDATLGKLATRNMSIEMRDLLIDGLGKAGLPE